MKNPEIECEVFPLFSSPVGVLKIHENLDNLQKIKKYSFVNIKDDYQNSSGITVTKELLKDFPDEEKIILKYFNYYKNNVLKLESTEFKITSSWGTKTTDDSFSEFHTHKNSYFTSVLYLDDDENAAHLEIDSENIFPQEIMVNNPTEWNIFNLRSWSISPQKNMILFFPNYLRHRIGKHNSKKPRYSIALNLFPTGKIGYNDSIINLSVDK